MSATPCTVDGCGRPVEDAYVCNACTIDLERALGDVRWLDEQLDVVLTKQTAANGGAGYTTGSKGQPLPYDPRASEARWVLVNTITTWARVVLAEKPRADLPGVSQAPDGPVCERCLHPSCRRIRATEPSLGGVATWLGSYADALRHLDQGEAVGDLLAAIRAARHVVDVAPERWYAGPCDGVEGQACGQDLYAKPNAARLTCPACGAIYDAAERRAWLVEAAHDHLGTAREVVALCKAMLGDLISEDMLRGYVKRGRLAPHGTTLDRRGRVVATYRVGDVIEVAKVVRWDEREQRATRRAGRSA